MDFDNMFKMVVKENENIKQHPDYEIPLEILHAILKAGTDIKVHKKYSSIKKKLCMMHVCGSINSLPTCYQNIAYDIIFGYWKLPLSYHVQRNEILNRQASQAEYRKDFVLQSKIEILKAQGKESEAKQLEFAQKRNELMEKTGYSLEKATKIQKVLDAAKNGAGKVEYSDEAKSKAKRILERGEGGSVGKRAIEDAQKIMSGEGGLKSTLFRDFEKESKNNSVLKNVNIDAKATRENLDAEANKIEKENSNSLKEIQGKIDTLNQVATDIKNAAQMISTQIKNTGTNSNG